MASVRAFVAVGLDADTRDALAAACSGLRDHARELSPAWVAPENFHVTLKFLGSIDDARVPSVADALRASVAGQRSFALEIRGLGSFPSPTRPRVVWAGIQEGTAPLAALAEAVDAALAGLGFEREPRAFTPHVTLARIREPRRAQALADAIARAATHRFGRTDVQHLTLMRSDLSPRGARYSALAAIPLSA